MLVDACGRLSWQSSIKQAGEKRRNRYCYAPLTLVIGIGNELAIVSSEARRR